MRTKLLLGLMLTTCLIENVYSEGVGDVLTHAPNQGVDAVIRQLTEADERAGLSDSDSEPGTPRTPRSPRSPREELEAKYAAKNKAFVDQTARKEKDRLAAIDAAEQLRLQKAAAIEAEKQRLAKEAENDEAEMKRQMDELKKQQEIRRAQKAEEARLAQEKADADADAKYAAEEAERIKLEAEQARAAEEAAAKAEAEKQARKLQREKNIETLRKQADELNQANESLRNDVATITQQNTELTAKVESSEAALKAEQEKATQLKQSVAGLARAAKASDIEAINRIDEITATTNGDSTGQSQDPSTSPKVEMGKRLTTPSPSPSGKELEHGTRESFATKKQPLAPRSTNHGNRKVPWKL